jgi:16S rRNA (cytosine1402-N4)-methyltransferase
MEANNLTYHIPVLLNECVDGLNLRPDGTYVDVTFGGGGHSRCIYQQLSEEGTLIAFDQDAAAIQNTWKASNFLFIQSNFTFLKNQLKLAGYTKVHGILADLGVSSHQFDTEQRGFTLRSNAPLDMRMNQQALLTAEKVLNEYTEEELLRVLRSYSDITNTRKVVNAVLLYRGNKALKSTGDLIEAVQSCTPKSKPHKFLAQLFQAIRIEVNDEMGALRNLLEQSVECLETGGRIAIISYHSIEDRMVKNYFKKGSVDGKETKDFFGNLLKPFNEINRKPVVPSMKEQEENSRSRSAKLRIAERNA